MVDLVGSFELDSFENRKVSSFNSIEGVYLDRFLNKFFRVQKLTVALLTAICM
jgi:hypothetical protein